MQAIKSHWFVFLDFSYYHFHEKAYSWKLDGDFEPKKNLWPGNVPVTNGYWNTHLFTLDLQLSTLQNRTHHNIYFKAILRVSEKYSSPHAWKKELTLHLNIKFRSINNLFAKNASFIPNAISLTYNMNKEKESHIPLPVNNARWGYNIK